MLTLIFYLMPTTRMCYNCLSAGIIVIQRLEHYYSTMYSMLTCNSSYCVTIEKMILLLVPIGSILCHSIRVFITTHTQLLANLDYLNATMAQ